MNSLDEVRKAIASKDDRELIKSLVDLNKQERATSTDILLHLIEVEQRKLHLELGHSSLFSYACKELCYSEPAAHRRISSARCINRIPELYPMLLVGEVSLTTISLIAQELTPENKAELLPQLCGASRKQVEKLVARIRGGAPAIRDCIKPVFAKAPAKVAAGSVPSGQTQKQKPPVADAPPKQRSEEQAPSAFSRESAVPEEPNCYEVRCSVSAAVRAKLERTQELLSNKVPLGASLEDVLDAALECYLEKHAPERRAARRTERLAKRRAARCSAGEAKQESKEQASEEKETSSQAPAPSSRHVPATLSDTVHLRDGGQCTYESADGMRCTRRTNLHIDHIVPLSRGGTTCEANLRLLCGPHNQFMADKLLGREFMQKKRTARG